MADDSDLLSAYNPQSVPQATPPAADTPEYKSDLLSGFDPATGGAKEVPDTSYGVAKTAAIHGLQGATLGFGDEMRALSEAGGNKLGLPLPNEILHGLARLGYEKLISGDHEAIDKYHQAREYYRKELEQSAQEHPYIAAGSDVAGSMLVPGGYALK